MRHKITIEVDSAKCFDAMHTMGTNVDAIGPRLAMPLLIGALPDTIDRIALAMYDVHVTNVEPMLDGTGDWPTSASPVDTLGDVLDYKWWAGRDEEHFSLGPFDTREQAIDEGRSEFYDDEGPGFHIIEAAKRLLDVSKFMSAAQFVENLLERVDEDIIDEHGNEDGDPMLDPTPEQEKDLAAMFKATFGAWQLKHKIVVEPYVFTHTRHREHVPAAPAPAADNTALG